MSDFIDDPVIENDEVNVIHQDSSDENQDSTVVDSDNYLNHPVVGSNNDSILIGSENNNNVVDKASNEPSFGHRLTTVAVENDNTYQVPFGGKEDDKVWNEKQAAHAYEEENWHLEQAKKAAERGDFAAAKDHRSTAASWHNTGNDYASKAKN